MGNLWQWLREAWRRISYVSSRYVADRCHENAAALTYMSLFALVPLLTVLYTIASAVPVFQGLEAELQSLVLDNLVPQSGTDIEQYINDFSRQARNLSGPGIAFLVVTAVLMLRNIEKAFNHIWRARKNRSTISSFLLYWAILTLAPVTIGAALAMGTYLSSFAHTLQDYDIIGLQALLLKSAPLLLSTAGFSLVYAAVPNCHVPFRHALIGGLLAALAANVARFAFTQFVAGSSITFIYGAFAAVPLFLMWLYINWLIVLMGCILVHSLSAYQNETQAGRPQLFKALDVLHLFWLRQQQGAPVREKDILANHRGMLHGMDSVSWGELRDLFIREKVIAQSDQGHYVLCRDLHSVRLWQLQSWLRGELPLDRPELRSGEHWQEEVHSLMVNQRKLYRENLNISLAELFEQ